MADLGCYLPAREPLSGSLADEQQLDEDMSHVLTRAIDIPLIWLQRTILLRPL